MHTFLAVFPLVFAIYCLAVPTRPPGLRQGCLTNNLSYSLDIFALNPGLTVQLRRGERDVATNTAFMTSVDWIPTTFFLLRDGIILAFDNPGEFRGIVIGAEPGKEITFFAADGDPASVPGHGRPFFCAQLDRPGSSDLILAFEGDSTAFSFCKSSTSIIHNVVYRATPFNNGSYDYNSCFDLKLSLRFNPA